MTESKKCRWEFDDYVSEVTSDGDRLITARDGSFLLFMDAESGLTVKKGRNALEPGPYHMPWGPEIADIEITTSCHGIRGRDNVRRVCPHCYKSNTPEGKYMSLETFKRVFGNLNRARTLTQVALGVDAECRTNPDVWKIMDYCLENHVKPNVTVADIDDETADNIVKRCGACAVSCYQHDKSRCYDSVKLLTDRAPSGFKVNIHLLMAEETLGFCKEVIADRSLDPRLEKAGAVVFLSLKQKGRGTGWTPLSQEQFNGLMTMARMTGIPYGMDSCSAAKFMEFAKNLPEFPFIERVVEPCESLLFSVYVNVDGLMFPCSFLEGLPGYEGIDLTKDGVDFWHDPRTNLFRAAALSRIEQHGCNTCPYYKI